MVLIIVIGLLIFFGSALMGLAVAAVKWTFRAIWWVLSAPFRAPAQLRRPGPPVEPTSKQGCVVYRFPDRT